MSQGFEVSPAELATAHTKVTEAAAVARNAGSGIAAVGRAKTNTATAQSSLERQLSRLADEHGLVARDLDRLAVSVSANVTGYTQAEVTNRASMQTIRDVLG
ncbi:hypothetical protein [Yinghuangia sp. YIM S10712]|uniref:hypothetical protein n=1 Tax=Yinghuangia sp. YIM S10712 TaxID=3436930 RepID=UPI003F53968D